MEAQCVLFGIGGSRGKLNYAVTTAFSVKNLGIVIETSFGFDCLRKPSHLNDVTLRNLGNRPIGVLLGCNVQYFWLLEEQSKNNDFVGKTVWSWVSFGPMNDAVERRISTCHSAIL